MSRVFLSSQGLLLLGALSPFVDITFFGKECIRRLEVFFERNFLSLLLIAFYDLVIRLL